MRHAVMIAFACALGSNTFAALRAFEDFESLVVGPLGGQVGGGGISWVDTPWSGNVEVFNAIGGYESSVSAKWDVSHREPVSLGDEVVGIFPSVGPQVTVTAWTYAYLNAGPQSVERSAEFSVLDSYLGGSGAGLVWRSDGYLGDTSGASSSVPYVNLAWKQIRIELDYDNETFETFYDDELVTAGKMQYSASSATVLDILLQTLDLNDGPNPNDQFLIDDIMIYSPEPAGAFALLAGAGLLLRRR